MSVAGADGSRARALIFLAVAGAAGVAAVFLVNRYTTQLMAEASDAVPAVTPVVVANEDLPIATQLNEKQLKVVMWPSEHLPDGTISDPTKIVTKTLKQSVVRGEPILDTRLADESQGHGLAALLADGMRAMAVEVDAMVGVAGFVQPGDFVDVITTMRPDGETNSRRREEAAHIARIILQNVPVLAVGEHLTTEAAGKPMNVKVVTLGVTPTESERLALASQYGRIQLSLRSRIDQALQTTPGISPAELLAPDRRAPEPVAVGEPKPRRPYRHSRAQPREAKTFAPDSPTVEILRGSQVESRTLRQRAEN